MSEISNGSHRISRLEDQVADLRVCTARLSTVAAERGRLIDSNASQISALASQTASNAHHVKSLYAIVSDNRERIKSLEGADKWGRVLILIAPVILFALAAVLKLPPHILGALTFGK